MHPRSLDSPAPQGFLGHWIARDCSQEGCRDGTHEERSAAAVLRAAISGCLVSRVNADRYVPAPPIVATSARTDRTVTILTEATRTVLD